MVISSAETELFNYEIANIVYILKLPDIGNVKDEIANQPRNLRNFLLTGESEVRKTGWDEIPK